jgi:hypothetical protein
VRGVFAKSFARIHRRNLTRQGILALTFVDDADFERAEVGQCWCLPHIRDELAEGSDRITVCIEDNGDEFALTHDFADKEREILLPRRAARVPARRRRVITRDQIGLGFGSGGSGEGSGVGAGGSGSGRGGTGGPGVGSGGCGSGIGPGPDASSGPGVGSGSGGSGAGGSGSGRGGSGNGVSHTVILVGYPPGSRSAGCSAGFWTGSYDASEVVGGPVGSSTDSARARNHARIGTQTIPRAR